MGVGGGRTAVLIHLLAIAAVAASPTAKIDAPPTALAGGVAKVKFNISGTTDWEFECDPSPSWMDKFPNEDGEVTVVIHSAAERGACSYDLRLILVVDGKLRKDKVDLRFLSPVNSTPVPIAGRMPPAEDEQPREQQSATAALTYKLAREMAKADPDQKARLMKEAQIVADVLRDGRAKVIERRIETFEELERFTAVTCLNKLGKGSFDLWRVDFLDEFSDHLDELSAAGNLTIMQAYADVWLEAAKGLERFAGK
jgi:hypothetical protein